MMPSDAFENLLGVRVFREYIFSLFSKRVLELMQLVEEVAFHKLDKHGQMEMEMMFSKMSHFGISDPSWAKAHKGDRTAIIGDNLLPL